MKATFVDFEDSFSYNVVQELTDIGFHVNVISWKDFESLPENGLLVLGPGPGHPDDYEQIFPMIRTWLQNKKPFFGVCLGHQIFWRIEGEDVVRSKEPLHGQRIKLEFNADWKNWLGLKDEVFVQRYNSLAVLGHGASRTPYYQNYIQDDEILITKSDSVITYQFHPESVGTSYRKAFFKVVCSIL